VRSNAVALYNCISAARNTKAKIELLSGIGPKMIYGLKTTYSRAFFDFVLNDLNLTEFIRRLGSKRLILSTLNSADVIKAPGGFTQQCMLKGINLEAITTAVYYWHCEAERVDLHCALNIRDLPMLLKNATHMYTLDLSPSYDYGAVECWYEELFNRTYRQPMRGISELDKSIYTELPHVFTK